MQTAPGGGGGYHHKKSIPSDKLRTKMIQTTVTTTCDQNPAPPAPAKTTAKAKDADRCTFTFPNRSRCRLQAQNPQSGLCGKHASAMEPHDTDDLSGLLFEKLPEDELPGLQTPEDVNTFLARVVVLLAEGRISPRRATVFTYAASLLLRSAMLIDAHSEVIYDILPDRTDNQQTAQPQEPSPVLTGATR
jgi:hypothetical protein